MLPDTTDHSSMSPEKQVDALGEEFTRSLHALASGALEALEESLWRQQLLCADLQKLIGQDVLRSGAELARLKSAAASLSVPQQQLAGVLEQASASAAVLHRLCATYQANRSAVAQTSVHI